MENNITSAETVNAVEESTELKIARIQAKALVDVAEIRWAYISHMVNEIILLTGVVFVVGGVMVPIVMNNQPTNPTTNDPEPTEIVE
jgi:hypothetical protein